MSRSPLKSNERLNDHSFMNVSHKRTKSMRKSASESSISSSRRSHNKDKHIHTTLQTQSHMSRNSFISTASLAIALKREELDDNQWSTTSTALVFIKDDAIGSPSKISYGLHDGRSDYNKPPYTDNTLKEIFPVLLRPTSYQQVRYTPMIGNRCKLIPYRGQYVALLAPISMSPLNPYVMTSILKQYDECYKYYLHMNNNIKPKIIRQFTVTGKNLLAIAIVDQTISNTLTCSMRGYYGIEIHNTYFRRDFICLEDSMYAPKREISVIDPITRRSFTKYLYRPERLITSFCEMANNFWSFDNKLTCESISESVPEYSKCLRQSFSYLLGIYFVEDYLKISSKEWFIDIKESESLGLAGSLSDGISFHNIIWNYYDTYMNSLEMTFRSTLLYGLGLPTIKNSGTLLFTSFLFELCERYGKEQFIINLFKHINQAPNASNFQESIDNLIYCSSLAANRNLTNVFSIEWRWPISPRCKRKLLNYFKVPDENLSNKGIDEVILWLRKLNFNRHINIFKKLNLNTIGLIAVISDDNYNKLMNHKLFSSNSNKKQRLMEALRIEKRRVQIDVKIQDKVEFPHNKIPYLWGLKKKEETSLAAKVSARRNMLLTSNSNEINVKYMKSTYKQPKLPSFHHMLCNPLPLKPYILNINDNTNDNNPSINDLSSVEIGDDGEKGDDDDSNNNNKKHSRRKKKKNDDSSSKKKRKKKR